MAALSGHQLARTAARVGVSRVGATRIGFAPTKTWNGTTPGTAGGLYIWVQALRTAAEVTWAAVTR